MAASNSNNAVSAAQRFYSRNIELSVSIRELDREYYIGPRQWLSYRNPCNQFICVYWKPPGALMWVSKWVTESLSGNTLEFVNKGYFDVEDQDLSAVPLRLEFYGSTCRWSVIETHLDRIISAGSRGLVLSLPLDLENIPEYLKNIQSDIVPAFVHLRAEFVTSVANDNLGFKIFLSAVEQKGRSPKCRVEIHKVNDDNCMEMSHPYTIIYRDDEINKSDLKDFKARTFYINESKITNGDMDRVLKVALCTRKNGEKKGFTLFTLSDLLKTRLQCLNFTAMDGKPMKLSVQINLSQVINLKTFSDFVKLGLKFISVYAVNYSQSNWDVRVHAKSLHEPHERGITPYEEALEMITAAMECLSSDNVDKPRGESVFYGFGDEDSIMVQSFGNDNHLKHLLDIYHDMLWSVLFKAMNVNEYNEEEEDVKLGREESEGNHPSTSSQTFSCVPQPCRPCRPLVLKSKGLLAPLLEDVYALLCTRPKQEIFSYFIVFILTDGEFADFDLAVDAMRRLGDKPVSVILVGIGSADFFQLMELSNCWTGTSGTSTGPPFRRNLHLVHFRSSHQWLSALYFYKIRSKPQDIFMKEILTPIREQAVSYLRLYHPDI